MSLYYRATTAVVDIDGVLATGTKEDVYSDAAGWAYDKCEPIKAGLDLVKNLNKCGVKVILYTARFEEDRAKTETWLAVHEVVHSKLIMGKPQAEIYIDDKGFRFNPGQTIFEVILDYIRSSRMHEFNEEV